VATKVTAPTEKQSNGIESWGPVCPVCRAELQVEDITASCRQCAACFRNEAAIWEFIPEDRLVYYRRFLEEYRLVRESQGWGETRAEYFQRLPVVKLSDPRVGIWRRRGLSYADLLRNVIDPSERELRRQLDIVDAGAGNCWLSFRLVERGHNVVSVDLSADQVDGLGAHRWYGESSTQLLPVRAEFDHLPFCERTADIVIFNASLHYSGSYETTLAESLRVLRPAGRVVVMDSPVYHDAGSGRAMVEEREREFEKSFGFRSNSLDSEGFLTHDRLGELAQRLNVRWRLEDRRPTPLERLRRSGRHVRGRRELATMPLVIGSRA
jgi:SAM-dependent methyltransferase